VGIYPAITALVDNKMTRDEIETIIAAGNLYSLVERAGGELHREGSEFRCACPLHGGKNSSGFAVYSGRDGKDRWTCFSGDCGSGDIISLVQKWQRLDFVKACEWLSNGKPINPAAAAEIAAERAERAARELEETIAKAQAALRDLRAAERHLYYHQQMDELHRRALWYERGLADWTIDFLKLGYCPSFNVGTKEGLLTTPTLSIPIFGKGWELLNIRHRLLTPRGNDKYRPERSGLGAAPPLLFDPDLGYDTERILWVEGEIKAAVVGQTLDTPGIQIVGLPGKTNWRAMVEKAKGKRNYINFDPGAEQDARAFAKEIGGARIIRLPEKIDDYINRYRLGKAWLEASLKNARMN
jgi:hypothetical protein